MGNRCHILIFDSLTHASHKVAIRNIKDYLALEAFERKGVEDVKDKPNGNNVKVKRD